MFGALSHMRSQLQGRSINVDPEPDVALREFFDPAFMREHTRFDTFEEFCSASPWALPDERRIESIPSQALDHHVAATTAFDSWTAMRNAAGEAEVIDRLLV